MLEKTLRILGSVQERQSGQPVAGVRVEAWDADLIHDDLVGSHTTNEHGGFYMEFDRSYFRELFLDREPDLYFKVFYQSEEIHNTQDSVRWNTTDPTQRVVIELETNPVPPIDIKPSRVVRLLFAYDQLNIQWIGVEQLKMFLPPSQATQGYEGQSGQWFELQTENEQVVYRRMVHNFIRFAVELHPSRSREGIEIAPEEGSQITWQELSEVRGIFTVLAPEQENAPYLVIFSSPLTLAESVLPASEVARFDLRERPRPGLEVSQA